MLHPDLERRCDMAHVHQVLLDMRAAVTLRMQTTFEEDDIEDRIAAKSSAFLSQASAAAKKKARYKTLKPNETLFDEGEKIESHDIYLLQAGTLLVYKGGMLLTTLKPGAVVGEMSLLLNQKERTATVRGGEGDGAKLLALSEDDLASTAGSGSAGLRPLAEMASRRLTQVETIML